MATRDTETLVSAAPRGGGRGPEWSLALAHDCERPATAPLRLALARTTELEIGRGAERGVRRDGPRVRLDVDDRWASAVHARLTRAAAGWVIADVDSKNGTRVNGRRVDHAELDDGDVIECGGTFLLLRRAPGPIGDLEARPAAPV